MAVEAQELRPGGEAVIARLADILVVQTIRAWIEQGSPSSNRVARRAATQTDRPRNLASRLGYESEAAFSRALNVASAFRQARSGGPPRTNA